MLRLVQASARTRGLLVAQRQDQVIERKRVTEDAKLTNSPAAAPCLLVAGERAHDASKQLLMLPCRLFGTVAELLH
jgi:hypothetical protein